MTDEQYHLTHDAAVVSFDSVTTDGITIDDDGSTEFDWDEIPIVKLDEPPHSRAFDTDEFYKIEGATTARPIQQPYKVGDDVEVYVKPADELRDAAWSLENRPYVLDHPDTGMVKDVRDIHGFWRNPRYDDDEDRLKEDLYIPKGDDEAMEFVANNQDVSLGFYNLLYRDYDGDIGSLVDPEEDRVDGYQVNLYVDHIAGVERGRCSSSHGCGLDSHHDHGEVVMQTDDTTSFVTREDQTKNNGDTTSDDVNSNTDQPSGIKTEDGTWFAVGPSEHNKDSTDHTGDHMFPVDNCSDVEDAWNLRNHAEDLSISRDTLEARIKRAGESHGCDDMPWENEDSIDVEEILNDYDPGFEVQIESTTNDNMTDNDNSFELPDLSIDALAEKHDDVRELREQKDELEADLEGVKDELGLDECPCETDLSPYADAYETLDEITEVLDADEDVVEFVEDMYEEWQDAQTEKKESLLDELEELKADRDEWEDESIDAIEEEIDRREEIAQEFDVSEVNESTDSPDDEGETTVTGRRRFARGEKA